MHHHQNVIPPKKKFKESRDFDDDDENAADIEDGDLIETEARGEEYMVKSNGNGKRSNFNKSNKRNRHKKGSGTYKEGEGSD